MLSRTDDRGVIPHWILASIFALMTVLVAVDLVTDIRAGTTAFHVLLEAAVIVIGFVAAGSIALRMHRLAHDTRDLREQLRASQQEAERWRSDASELIEGLGTAIDQQFTRWDLSPAEREVALLLLKGLSHKEIAEVRHVNETTVRQQARAMYRKAGLSGRNDLAAFFLEDLLVPRASR